MDANEKAVESLNRESLNRKTGTESETDSTVQRFNNSTDPNSERIYVSGSLHPDLRVPFREIRLSPTKTLNGQLEVNEPVRVYETSGPWGDWKERCEITQGLSPLRGDWIVGRGDVEEYS